MSARFGRVAVLCGGGGPEREVSLMSGRAVHAALVRRGIEAACIDGIPELLPALERGAAERVFNVMHGRDGEDGVVQGLLAARRVPVTGSGVLGSALSMDKRRSKLIWRQLGLPTPPAVLLDAGRDIRAQLDAERPVIEAMQPLVVKPNRSGSTVGLTLVERFEDLHDALTEAGRYDSQVLIEQRIAGEDWTVGMLRGEALPHLRIRPAGGLYDYEAKYLSDQTRYDTPALDDDTRGELQALALRACAAVAVTGWGRVDFMRGRDGKFWLLEVNTVPGMTDHSLLPMAAARTGMDFDELTMAILETSL